MNVSVSFLVISSLITTFWQQLHVVHVQPSKGLKEGFRPKRSFQTKSAERISIQGIYM